MNRSNEIMRVHPFYFPEQDILELSYYRPGLEPYRGVQLANDIVAGFDSNGNNRTKMLRIFSAKQHLGLYVAFDDLNQAARIFRGFKWNTNLPRQSFEYLFDQQLSTREFIDRWVIYEPHEQDWSWGRTHDRR